jgi:protease-4
MKKFLQQILASAIGSFAGFFLFFIVTSGGFLVLLIALLMSNNPTKIENQSALVFNLTSQISDYQNEVNFSSLLSDNSDVLNLREITSAINKAAKDDRISALYLDGSEGNILAGYGTLNEIRTALENFRQSGKKIIAYNVSAGEKDYFITSIADEISLNPMGMMELNGLASSQLFFADAFAKYGIGVQIIRVGKYKSAIEPFILSNYSPESKLQTTELLDDIWDSFLEKTSKNRSLVKNNFDNVANEKGILSSQESQNLKLIDKVNYEDQIIDKLKTITNSKNQKDFRQVDIKTYLNANSVAENYSNNQIAVLYLEGTIVDGEGQIGQVGSSRYIEEIRKIRQDKNIKGVVARINSPGGSAVASELILRELQLTAKEKPVVVSLGDVAASGGYWIATVGEKIFANDSTITGSIGVFGVLFNIEDIAKANGINNGIVKTNKLADLADSFNAKTPEELAIYQDNVERIYDLFLQKVSQARKIPIEQVNQIAQGRVWSGKSAKEKGLVDEIGGLDQAIEYLNTKLALNNKYQISNYPEQRSFETELLMKLSNSKIAEQLSEKETLAQLIWKSNTELELQQILENPYQVYSLLPYKLKIK